MSSRTRWWPVGGVALIIVTMLSQVVAVADSGGSGGAAGPDLPRVSNLLGRDFRINGGAANSDEWSPAVAYNQANNQYLVVREDGRNYATRGYDIHGQRVKATGKLAGGDFRISGPAATTDERRPAVACNPDDNQYLVVWHDDRDSGTRGRDIYGRRVAG